jgi:hypothetical protein
MPKPDLAVSLPAADWRKVIQALRNEAFHLSQESHRACEKGSRDYGTMLWEECSLHNALASEIEAALPIMPNGL